MDGWLQVLLLTLLAGLAMPAGGLLACFEALLPKWLERETRHGVMAFRGGALLSAVALVLVPEGTRELAVVPAALLFGGGGVAFMLLDRRLSRSGTPASQLAAMISDFLPEALALGSACALRAPSAFLLALLMALQNLPEGFNAFRELRAGGARSGRTVAALSVLALLGPACGFAGYFWLAGSPAVVGGIMLFAAGGILYLVLQDIAPQVRMEAHWAPPLGGVAGFLLGVVGQMLTA